MASKAFNCLVRDKRKGKCSSKAYVGELKPISKLNTAFEFMVPLKRSETAKRLSTNTNAAVYNLENLTKRSLNNVNMYRKCAHLD